MVSSLSLPYFTYYWCTQILGHNRGSRMCIEGKLLTGKQAFKIGSVDGIADDVSQLMSIANNKAEQLIKIPALAYSSLKKMSRLEFAENSAKYGHKQTLEFVEINSSDSANSILGDLLKSLRSKKI